MENKPNKGFRQSWAEFWGRQKQYLPPEFPDDKIVSEPYGWSVGLMGAGYVPSFAMVSVIVVSTSGERHMLRQGGYIQLPTGNYSLYYIDCRERYTTLPEVKAITSDGAQISITVGITYQVNDPLKVQNVRNPLDALYKGCEAALRHLIRTHKHDELIGETSDPKVVSDNDIIHEIKLQVSLNEGCRAFTLSHVSVLDRQGHTKLMGIREERIVQERVSERETEARRQKQKVALEQKELVSKEGEIIELQAQIEKNRQQILFVARQLDVELERLRKLPQFQHEEILKDIDARSKAIESLIQAQAMPGFPRNADDLHLVDKIVNGLPNIPRVLDQAAPEQTEEAKELSSTLVQLIIPKKR